MGIKIGEEFKPAPQFKTLYFVYLIIGVALGILPWFIPMSLFMPSRDRPVFFLLATAALVVLVFLVYWIRKYYDTINYKLTETEIVWRRGVWIKQTGIVPYNRITNIDISQGPIARKFGIASIHIQTAGYSAKQTAEIKIEGMEDPEGLRETIMGFVRGKKPLATETYEEGADSKIVAELVKIRKLLEKK